MRLRLLWVLILLALAAGCAEDPPTNRPIACDNTQDCPGGQFCGCDGLCYIPAACDTDDDCCTNETCGDGVCRLDFQCESDLDCSGSDVCTSCACVPAACSEEAPCADGQVCDGGVCLDQAEAPCGGCQDGEACLAIESECIPMPEACLDLECAPGEQVTVPEIDALLGPMCAEPTACVCAAARQIPRGFYGTEFSALRVSGTSFVALAYDRFYGDLVMVEIEGQDGDRVLTYIDGVPDEVPTGDPAGPRNGITQPGRDVGNDPSARWAGEPGGPIGVAYRDSEGALRFAIRGTDRQWTTMAVDGAGDAGYYPDLLVMPDGRWAVAYFARAADRSSLRLAVSSNATPAATQDWRIRTLVDGPADSAEGEDLPGGVGLFPSMEFDQGALWIAFYNSIDGNLEMAWGHPDASFEHTVLLEGTTRSEIPGSGDVGLYADLALTSAGELVVAYVDRVSGEVMFGAIDQTNDGPIFSGEPAVADPGRQQSPPVLVGAGLSIGFDSDNLPLVAYQDSSSGNLRIAHFDGGRWSALDAVRQNVSGFSPHLFSNITEGVVWVVHGVLESIDGKLRERIDVRPIPF
ncbi:MAG: hypothetical protein KC561_13150 [Myxococcales bacterium]|nr:hypothetical protein [Myxococcales bacterium]